MRQTNRSPAFSECIAAVVCAVVIMPKILECVEYKTVDVAKDIKDGRIWGAWQNSNGSPGISHRYGYADEPEEASSSYTTISAEHAEHVDAVDPSDANHAYLMVDKSEKDHSVSLDRPNFQERSLRKFVIQPVIQYVVKYNKRGQGDDDDLVNDATFSYGHGSSHQRMRGNHENRIERYFDDIDETIDYSADDDEDTDYDSRGKSNGRDGSNGPNGGGFQGENSNNGNYRTTSPNYQPPSSSAFTATGGYGGNSNIGQTSNGNGFNSNLQVSVQQQIPQHMQMHQMFGPPSTLPSVMGNNAGSFQNGPNVNGFSNSPGAPFASVSTNVATFPGMHQNRIPPPHHGGFTSAPGIAPLSSPIHSPPQMNMGPMQASGQMYGVPGSVSGQPFGSHQHMSNVFSSMGSSPGIGGIQTQTGPQNSYTHNNMAGVSTSGSFGQVGVSSPNSQSGYGNTGFSAALAGNMQQILQGVSGGSMQNIQGGGNMHTSVGGGSMHSSIGGGGIPNSVGGGSTQNAVGGGGIQNANAGSGMQNVIGGSNMQNSMGGGSMLMNVMQSQGMSSVNQNGSQQPTKDCDRSKSSGSAKGNKRPHASDEDGGQSMSNGKKPSGRGKSKTRGGKSILSKISLPKLPSSFGGHLSFMISTRFGRGRKMGSQNMSKTNKNKSSEMETKSAKKWK